MLLALSAGLVPQPARLMAGSALDAKVERHAQAALKLLKRDRKLDAARELEVAVTLAPQRVDLAELLQSLREGRALSPTAVTPGGIGLLSGPLMQRVQGYMAQAERAYHEDDGAVAEHAWRQALSLDGSQAKAREGLALLQAEAWKADGDQPFDRSVGDLYQAALKDKRKGRWAQAQVRLREALALNPDHDQALALLKAVDEGAAQAPEAQQERERQASEAQAKLAVLLRDAQSSESRGRWDEALAALQGAAALAPEDGALAARIAALSKRASKEKGLAQSRQEALRLYNEGVEAFQAGQLELAVSRFTASAELAPGDAEAKRALNAARRRLSDKERSQRQESQALVREARRLEERGSLAEALARYEKALARDQANEQAVEALGRLRAQIKGE